MTLLFRLKQPIARLLEAALLFFFFTLFTCVIIHVFTRYLLNNQAICTEESWRFATSRLSRLGPPYACGRLEHMAYPMFPEKLKNGAQLAHMRSVALMVLAFGLTVMCYGGGKLVQRALDFEQLSATLEVPMGYVYLCIPISGLLIVYYQLLILLKPAQFRSADEVEVALDHIAEEERKLAAQAGTDTEKHA